MTERAKTSRKPAQTGYDTNGGAQNDDAGVRRDHERDVLARLDDVRQDRALAEQRAAEALAGGDVAALQEARSRINAADEVLGHLQARLADDREVIGAHRAAGWKAAAAATVGNLILPITALDEEIHAMAEALAAKVKERADIAHGPDQLDLTDEILSLRFGLPRTRRSVIVPEPENLSAAFYWAREEGSPRGARGRRRRGPVASITASMSPDEVRRANLTALAAWMPRHGTTLPADVQAILREAPIPSDVLDLPKPTSPAAQRNERELEDVSQLVAETKRAISGLPGSIA